MTGSTGPRVDWSQKTVLVTGAGGFIGSHLTERLVALGATTRALVQYNSTGTWGWLDTSPAKEHVEVFLGDVQDRDSLRAALKGVDIVFHLAALIAIPYSYNAPISYVRTNVEGTLNVLQASLDAGAQLAVHTSTSEVYGTARQVPISEDHPLQGQSPYAASKIGADQMAQAFHLSFGLPVATIRPFNTYGPRQSARAVIPTIITQALTQPTVRLGNLAPTRDFSYVADTVEGFIRIAECPEAIGQVVNIGSGQEISVGELAKRILEVVGRDIPVICESERLRPENSEVDRLCADNNKAKDILGWVPQYTLKDGLAQTIKWMEKNIDRYRLGAYIV
ncbi:MAG: SDR family NAD(P)-dependent oxidoreductase [SAR202 cluster bacterium]|nr:SDR family NAD(P)-dependent oxidoreductase [SAR202 cluster bacterium]